jgi:hypothetical protein
MNHPPSDYPHVRASMDCPICHHHKDPGLVVCWPCFRGHSMRHGDNDTVRACLEAAEDRAQKTATKPTIPAIVDRIRPMDLDALTRASNADPLVQGIAAGLSLLSRPRWRTGS